MRQLLGVAGLVVLLSACGGAVSTPPPSPTPKAAAASTPTASAVPTGPNVNGCFTEKDGKIFSYGEEKLPAIIAGDGEVGVLITYERGGNVCTWRPLSDRLVAAGYRVLLYSRSSANAPAEVIVDMAGKLAKEEGVERLYLVGGSIGGTISVSAARGLKGVAGVVSMSGSPDPADTAKLTIPLLQIGSQEDYSGGAEAIKRAHDAATKVPDNQMKLFPGATHGSNLFTTEHGAQALDTILAFMDKHKG